MIDRATSFAAGVLVVALIAYGAIEAAEQPRDVPDDRLTPGAIASTDPVEVCATDGRPGSAYSRAHRGYLPWSERERVFRAYGVDPHDKSYQRDHRVPLCLGGADTAANEWPQPCFGKWNCHHKDAFEAYACRSVCNGTYSIPLATAQAKFLGDWRVAYRQAFGEP